mgnify:CR=1 FL=1
MAGVFPPALAADKRPSAPGEVALGASHPYMKARRKSGARRRKRRRRTRRAYRRTESLGVERMVLEAFDRTVTGVDPVVEGDPIIGGDVSDHMGGVGRSYVSIVGWHRLRV